MSKVLNKSYLNFIAELKQGIIKSRYSAARLANREQLLLYFFVGKRLAEKSNLLILPLSTAELNRLQIVTVIGKKEIRCTKKSYN